MKYVENIIKKSRAHDLLIRSWIPSKSQNKNILIVHGLGEHSGRYEDLANFLVKKKFGVFAVDLIGHGRSSGRRGHIKSFEEYLDTVELSLIYIRKKFLDIPIILFGHSLGGLISLKFLIDRESKEIDRSIISSPWIETKVKIPGFLLIIHKIFKNIFPSMQLHNNLITSHLSKDKDIVKKYEQDKLVHDRISLNLFSEILKTINEVLEKSSRIKNDILIYHGKDDMIISYEGSKKISNKIMNCKWILFENTYHEPHNDLEKSYVFKEIINFIK